MVISRISGEADAEMIVFKTEPVTFAKNQTDPSKST